MKQSRDLSAINRPLDWSSLEAMLDHLCPMHLRLTETGHIQHAGPTVLKMFAESSPVGTRFLEFFRLVRPRAVTQMRDLLECAQSRLHLKLNNPPHTGLKGALVRLPRGQGAIVNLSFGISVVEGVQHFDLTSADFAPTDLAIEMLYLVEAKSAAMEASRKLNHRLQGAKEAAETQASTDPLTGLKNRRAADHILHGMIETDGAFSLMHLDLDYFKKVNDTLGHAAGDYVLQHAAKVMRSETRESDTVARVGGDEFMIIFRDLTDTEQLRDIAERLIRGIEEPVLYEGQHCRISASIGIALCEADSDQSLDDLVQHSDQALYASKNRGRACVTFYDPALHASP